MNRKLIEKGKLKKVIKPIKVEFYSKAKSKFSFKNYKKIKKRRTKTMGKQMTFWLFIGLFQGMVDRTMAFRKIEEAKKAFEEYTGYYWDKITEDQEALEEFDCTKFSGSQISELQIEP